MKEFVKLFSHFVSVETILYNFLYMRSRRDLFKRGIGMIYYARETKKITENEFNFLYEKLIDFCEYRVKELNLS